MHGRHGGSDPRSTHLFPGCVDNVTKREGRRVVCCALPSQAPRAETLAQSERARGATTTALTPRQRPGAGL